MTNTKRENPVKPITASDLIEIGAKDFRKIEELLEQGAPIIIDEKATAIIRKDLDALSQDAQEKIKTFANEIGVYLEKPGFADASQMTGYISGLLDAPGSTAFSTLQSKFTQSSSTSKLEARPAFAATGIIFVLVVILFVLLVLLALKTALTGRPGSGGGGGGGGSSTPSWWSTIIHGPNDPNGPIGPG